MLTTPPPPAVQRILLPLLQNEERSTDQIRLEGVLRRLFNAPILDEQWFSPSFIRSLPLTAIQSQIDVLKVSLGTFQRLEQSGDTLVAVFERGLLRVTTAAMDVAGQLTALAVEPMSKATDPTARAQAKATVERVFNSEAIPARIFSDALLREIPLNTLIAQIKRVTLPLGQFVAVDDRQQPVRIVFQYGELIINSLLLDADGRVATLNIHTAPGVTRFPSLSEAQQAFSRLDGTVSVYVFDLDQMTPLIDVNSQKPLAVGSTFKLAVLAELKDRINSGHLTWLSMITLENMDRSLPSGSLQDAPVGSKYSLQDLAKRMIADSDNTATNTLLRVLGRGGIEHRIGQASIPNTREAFILKAAENSDLLRAYRLALGNQPARAQILSRAAQRALPSPQSFLPRPTVLDVEWFITTRKACELMGQVSHLEETTINPGVVDQQQFQRVSFKGGSEPGVLNLTTQIINKSNRKYCISASWNNVTGLDEVQFVNFYRGVVEFLK